VFSAALSRGLQTPTLTSGCYILWCFETLNLVAAEYPPFSVTVWRNTQLFQCTRQRSLIGTNPSTQPTVASRRRRSDMTWHNQLTRNKVRKPQYFTYLGRSPTERIEMKICTYVCPVQIWQFSRILISLGVKIRPFPLTLHIGFTTLQH